MSRKRRINWRSLIVILAAAVGFAPIWSGTAGFIGIVLIFIIGWCVPPVFEEIE